MLFNTGVVSLEVCSDWKLSEDEDLRCQYYSWTEWTDADASEDQSEFIRLSYHRHNDWKEHSWYCDPSMFIKREGFKYCNYFVVDDDFRSAFTCLIMANELEIPREKLTQILHQLSDTFVEDLLNKKLLSS